MGRSCPHCGCSEIDEDAARGDATCMGCGTVLEESIVVSENQFQERAGGSGHSLVGQFISMDRAHHNLQGVPGLSSQESREVTFQKGRRLIEEIASQLRINQHCIDTSFNFFKMCVTKNLTRGRLRSHVVVACMYMTCRLENTAHLLLDFSDVTQVNIFDLGKTLSFLSRSLFINLPTTDPCLYIMRFACLMELGDKQKEVVGLATRLVQRMKRDWLSTGRRPTGLCGAALLLAARAYNFNRSISDVVRIVHISESVVRKRLEEFSQTASGSLTIEEFASVDLDHSEDPPSFREAKRKAREKQALEASMAEKIMSEVRPVEEELERALEKKRREKFRSTAYADIVAGSGLDGVEVSRAEQRLLRNQVIDSVYEAVDQVEEASSYSSHYDQFRPTLESLGISKRNGADDVSGLPQADNPNGELNLDDIDDAEIDTYILTETESKMKEHFWLKLNGEHLKEMERRKREREEEELKGNEGGKKKKRRVHRMSSALPQANSAVEAMEKVIQEKKLSNKVNYDILKEIESSAEQFKNGFQFPATPTSKLPVALSAIKSDYVEPEPDAEDKLTKSEIHRSRANAKRGSEATLDTLKAVFKIENTDPEDSAKPASLTNRKMPSGGRLGLKLKVKPNLNVRKPMVSFQSQGGETQSEISVDQKPTSPGIGAVQLSNSNGKGTESGVAGKNQQTEEINTTSVDSVETAFATTSSAISQEITAPTKYENGQLTRIRKPNLKGQLIRGRKIAPTIVKKDALPSTSTSSQPLVSSETEPQMTSEEVIVNNSISIPDETLPKEAVSESRESTPSGKNRRPRVRCEIPEELLRRSSRRSNT